MLGKYNFDKEKGTLLINLGSKLADLDWATLSPTAKEQNFIKKPEFHVTILGFRLGQKIKDLIKRSGQSEENLLLQIDSLASSIDWDFEIKPQVYRINKDYPLSELNDDLQKETRGSIIQMVDCVGAKNFFDGINQILETDLEVPPLHVTLFSKSTVKENEQMGIGINSWDEFKKLNPKLLGRNDNNIFKTIVLPTRPQPDTIVAIFILKKFGENVFPGIKNANIEFWQMLPSGENEISLAKKGYLLIDIGGGQFDHHAFKGKITASDLISQYLEISDNPALAKLIEYARRDDFYGKGTVSPDPIDRAFGLSSLIAVLNKSLIKDPGRVVDITLPLLIAHYNEELRRTKELPEEFESKLASGEAEIFTVKQRDKKLRAVIINSESGSLAGYLRSQNGGKFDVVAQWLPTNHVNILTRPTKRPDLRSLVAIIRLEEATVGGYDISLTPRDLARFGRLKEIPEWYYDPATNSIQNGGLNPKEVNPTKITRERFKKIIELGLSEQLWNPLDI